MPYVSISNSITFRILLKLHKSVFLLLSRMIKEALIYIKRIDNFFNTFTSKKKYEGFRSIVYIHDIQPDISILYLQHTLCQNPYPPSLLLVCCKPASYSFSL